MAHTGIGTLNENPLHAALKDWYARPGDRFEEPVAGYLVDIVRGDLAIEIQTAAFAAIRAKLRALVSARPVRLVYPIAHEKWIVRLDGDGPDILGRRRSPRRGSVTDVFEELVSIAALPADPNFSLHLVLAREEEVRRYDGRLGRWRHGWVVSERRLLGVLDDRLFERPADFCELLPRGLAEPFTTADLARAGGINRRCAQQMAYCLRKMGVLSPVGRSRDGILHLRA